MRWLFNLRGKLFVSHLLIIVIGVIMLLTTAHFLSGTALLAEDPFAVGATATEMGQASPPTSNDAASAARERFQSIVDQALLIAAFAGLTATVVVSWFVSRRIVAPLQELTQVSRRLAQGYYRERTTIRSDDELNDLSQSINQLAQTLEQTEQRRLALITDVAHELRTPLTTIEGYMEGLIDGVIAPEPQIFAMLQHEATRLKWLIEEMALLSRAEAGLLRVTPAPIALRPLVERVSAQLLPQFVSQDLKLELRIPTALPTVYADPDRVEQILINLLANALQYTPSGGEVAVTISAQDFYEEVCVRDTGIGIPAEHLPHVFERFYRVDKSRTRSHGGGGTGIGLTIVRHLVYAQGGEVWAQSEGAGRGSTFHFTLPIHEPVAAVV
jgi:histidine kinase